MQIDWRKIIFFGFFLIIILAQMIYWYDPISLESIWAMRDQLFRFIELYPFIAAGIYIVLYVLSILFGIPISITLIGGYLFGALKGLIYSMLAIAIGVTIFSLLARYLLHDWVQDRYGDALKPFNEEIKKYGIYYVLLIHTMPFMPSFLPNVAFSVSPIPLYKVIGMNIFGAFPLTLVYVLAGSYLHSLSSMNDVIWYVAIFGGLIALPFIILSVYRLYQKK